MQTSDRSNPTRAGIIAGVLIAILFALSWMLMQGRELWLDEAHSVYVARLPFTQVLSAVGGDVHPPLYFLVLNGWVAAFGDSPTALRLFSVLSMVLAAIIVWRTAQNEDGEFAGLVALAFVALSPALLIYAVEIRMYAFGMLTFALALYFVQRVRTTLTTRDAILAGVAGALAVYTHYAALFGIAGLFGAWLLLGMRDARTRRTALIACATSALLVLPWVPTLFSQRARKQAQGVLVSNSRTDSTSIAFGAPASSNAESGSKLRRNVENVASVLGVYPARSSMLLLLLAIPFGVLGLAVLYQVFRGDTWTLLLLASAGATLAGVMFLGLGERRYMLFLAALSALALVRGVTQIETPKFRILLRACLGAVVGLLAAGSGRALGITRSTAVGELVGKIKVEAGPNDRLLFSAPYGQLLFDYYGARAGLSQRGSGFPESTADWWARQEFKGWGSPVPTFTDLDRTVAAQRAASASGGDVWLMLFETHYYDPRGLLRSRFASEGRVISEWTASDSSWTAVRVRMQ